MLTVGTYVRIQVCIVMGLCIRASESVDSDAGVFKTVVRTRPNQ